MSISFACSHCKTKITVAAAAAGKRGKCQKCGKSIVVPGLVKKICTLCGIDVAQKKRTKDALGNYYCEPCWNNRDVGSYDVQPLPLVAAGSNKPASAREIESYAMPEADEPRSVRTRSAMTSSRREGSNSGGVPMFAVIAALLVISMIGGGFIYYRLHGNTSISAQVSAAATSLNTTAGASLRAPAPMNCSIHGAAYIQFKDGRSDLVRGVQLTVLKPVVDRDDCTTIYRQLLPIISTQRDDLARHVEGDKVSPNPDDPIETEDVHLRWEKESKALKTVDTMAEADDPSAISGPVPTEEVFLKIRNADALEEFVSTFEASGSGVSGFGVATQLAVSGDTYWPSIIEKYTVTQFKGDADGKFTFSLPCAKYVIYAKFETGSGSLAEWAVPIDLTGKDDFALDLSNDNANVVN